MAQGSWIQSLFTETPGVRTQSTGHIGTVPNMTFLNTCRPIGPLLHKRQRPTKTLKYFIYHSVLVFQSSACLWLPGPNLPKIILKNYYLPLRYTYPTISLRLNVSVRLTLLPIIGERLFHFDVGNLTRVP